MKVNDDLQPLRRPGRPSVDRRDEILDAAQRLYERIGFEKTTVTDIARELSMSPANLYRSFADRRAIDEAIARRKLSEVEDVAWTAARTADEDAAAALRRVVLDVHHASMQLFFNEGNLHRLCAQASRERWPVVERFVRGLHGALRHVVMEGQRAGTFAASDPDDTAGALLDAVLKVWHPHMLELHKGDDLERDARRLATLLSRSLAMNNE